MFLPVLNADLIGYWDFDEGSGSTAIDRAGTHNGALVNAAYTLGHRGSALHFNGSNSFVRIDAAGSKLSLAGTAYTLAWWQKWNGESSQEYQRIISMDDGFDFSGGYSVWIYRPNASIGATHNSGPDQNWSANVIPAIGEWEHYALTFDGTHRRLFRNGSLVNSVATSGLVKSDNDDPLLFGAIDTGTSVIQYFNGDLDEVRFYNHALRPDEIGELFSPIQIEFALEPSSTTVSVGNRARFTALALANGDSTGINYQWFENGSLVLGATNASYQTDFRTAPGIFQIQVLASKGTAAKISPPAVLTVSPAAKLLLAHWDFEEQSGDEVFDGVANAKGRIVNAVRTKGKHGERALHFDGSSYAIVDSPPEALDLVNTAYTLAWWQRLDSLPDGRPQRIIVKDDGADYSGGYSVDIWSNNQLQSVHNSGSDQNWSSGLIPSTNWQHFALSFDGSQRYLYLNGDLYAQVPTTGDLRSEGDDPLVFGAIASDCCGLIQFFRGDLDDIRFYNYSLSSEEIKAFLPPAFIRVIQQPVDTTIGRNDTATFSVTAFVEGANSPLTFQWRENGIPIPGATNKTFMTGPEPFVMSKSFDVIVSSGDLTRVESAPATLRIIDTVNGILIAHWPLDELSGDIVHDVADSNHGISTGVSWIPGRVGTGALRFGPSGSIKVSGTNVALELVGTAYTLNWWQKFVPSARRFQEIVSCLDLNASVTGYSVFWDNGILNLLRSSAAGSEVVGSGIRASSTEWQNFAIVWDGKSHRFYVNGSLARSVPASGNLVARGRPDLFIGSRGGISNFFGGLLDEVRIYSYALSQNEVQELLVPPLPPALSIRLDINGLLKLTWISQSTNVFRVEQAERLQEGTTWQPLGSTPNFDRGTNILDITLPESDRFFRLRAL
jgi:hypothetical protein